MALTKKTLAVCILSVSLAGIGCSTNTSSSDPEEVGSSPRNCDELEPKNPYALGACQGIRFPERTINHLQTEPNS